MQPCNGQTNSVAIIGFRLTPFGGVSMRCGEGERARRKLVIVSRNLDRFHIRVLAGLDRLRPASLLAPYNVTKILNERGKKTELAT